MPLVGWRDLAHSLSIPSEREIPDASSVTSLPDGSCWRSRFALKLILWQRMAWRLRKSLKLGPIKLNLSKSGVGASIGVRGLRVGTDAKGRSYTATSIPGTGLYQRNYSSQGKAAASGTAPSSGAAARQASGVGLGLGVLVLAFLLGGLVVYLLIPRPIAPPVTAPAALSAPPAPVQPIPVQRRHSHRTAQAAKSATTPQ